MRKKAKRPTRRRHARNIEDAAVPPGVTSATALSLAEARAIHQDHLFLTKAALLRDEAKRPHYEAALREMEHSLSLAMDHNRKLEAEADDLKVRLADMIAFTKRQAVLNDKAAQETAYRYEQLQAELVEERRGPLRAIARAILRRIENPKVTVKRDR